MSRAQHLVQDETTEVLYRVTCQFDDRLRRCASGGQAARGIRQQVFLKIPRKYGTYPNGIKIVLRGFVSWH
jgi:hypothetical protein